MELFVTGRILDGNTLIGYKVWALNSNNVLEYKIIRKDEVQKLFEKYHVRNCEYNKSTNGLKSKLTIPISEYPRYDKWMGLSTKNQYTDSHIIAMTLNKRVDDIRFMVCGLWSLSYMSEHGEGYNESFSGTSRVLFFCSLLPKMLKLPFFLIISMYI